MLDMSRAAVAALKRVVIALALALAAPAHADPARPAEILFLVNSSRKHARPRARTRAASRITQARRNTIAALKRTPR